MTSPVSDALNDPLVFEHVATFIQQRMQDGWPSGLIAKDLIENFDLKAKDEAADQSPADERWQPIETAPKDGSEFLAWTGSGVTVALHYHGGKLVEREDYCGWNEGYGPSHWQPLPKGPAIRNGDEGMREIGKIIAYWLRYERESRREGEPAPDLDTHIIMPTWPSYGQLCNWLDVIAPDLANEARNALEGK